MNIKECLAVLWGMKYFAKQMKLRTFLGQISTVRSLLATVVLVIGIGGAAQLKADEQADRILQGARFQAALQQNQDLHGSMRKNGVRTPVSLFLRGEDIQFFYQTPKRKERFHMRLKDDGYDLFEILKGKTSKFNDAKIGQAVNGTDLSFEDLSMRFLYWKNSQVVGQERVGTQTCNKLRLINPDQTGNYRIVYVWVHEKYGALMKVVGYNAAGRPLKQFQVTDLMKVGKGQYTLERMRVDSIDAASNRITGTTYLEFNKPQKAAPGRR